MTDRGKPVAWRKGVFGKKLLTDQNYRPMETVQGTQWKYIRYFFKENDRKQYLTKASMKVEKSIFEELFNLKNDPKEQCNLAGNPESAIILEVHRKRCQELVNQLAR